MGAHAGLCKMRLRAGAQAVLDMQQALAEVYALRGVDHLVRTTGSTFITAAYAIYPKKVCFSSCSASRISRRTSAPSAPPALRNSILVGQVWYITEGEQTCHQQFTTEPIALGNSEAVMNQVITKASCVRAGFKKMLNFAWVFTAT